LGIKGVLAWRFVAKKINADFVRHFLRCIIEYLGQKYSDPNDIYRELKKIYKYTGELIYIRYLQATKRPAESLRDLVPTYNLGFKFFTGKPFDKIEYKEEGKDVYITYRIRDCPFCRGMEVPIKVPFCLFFAGVLEWIEEQRLEDWNAESITCDEVKCKMLGDDVCEYRAHIKLK